MEILVRNILNLLKESFNKNEFNEIKKLANNVLEKDRNNKIPADEKSKEDTIKAEISINIIVDLVLTFIEDKSGEKKYAELLNRLGRILISSSSYYSSIPIFKKIISYCSENNNLKEKLAEGYYNLGDIYSRQAEWELSISYLKKAKKIFQEKKDKQGLAKIENLLGTIYGDCGQLGKSKKHFEKCLELINKTDKNDLRGKVLINLGIIETINGNYDSAYRMLSISLKENSKTKNQRRIAEIKHNIGMLFIKKEDYSKAIKALDECIEISKEHKYPNLMSISYSSKAFIYSDKKEDEKAIYFADKSNETAFNINDKLTVADNYKIKGMILRNNKKYKESENYLLTSIRLNNEYSNVLNKAEAEFELALLYKETRQKEKSEEYLKKALNYYKETSIYSFKKNEYQTH